MRHDTKVRSLFHIFKRYRSLLALTALSFPIINVLQHQSRIAGMAKRRRRLRQQKISRTSPLAPLQEDNLHGEKLRYSAIIHPFNLTPKPGIARAQEKHKNDHVDLSSIQKPSLADRLYALPQELRNHIFSILLTRPVKWDAEHMLDCPLRSHSDSINPESDWNTSTCAACLEGYGLQAWREEANTKSGWISPWRSSYAPEPLNRFLCSTCWDDRWRPKPFPQAKTLPCLCARRPNLQILSVCRRWYEEASRVFYTENTFAFEDSSTFVSFVQNLDPKLRNRISKVSIMVYTDEAATAPGANIAPNANFDELRSGWESSARLQPVWTHLRQLPSLAHLELDALFLSRSKTVTSMRKLGLGNLRSVRFCARMPDNEVARLGSPFVWQEFAKRTRLQGGLAEAVARAVKGQKVPELKAWKLVQHAVEQHNAQMVSLTTARDERG